MALQDKVNFAIIDLACGHKQKSIAMDYYIHLSDDIIKNEDNEEWRGRKTIQCGDKFPNACLVRN